MIKLEEVERLKLENFQLRLEILKKSIFEVKVKEQEILKIQSDFAQQLEQKYKIKLEDFNIDLIAGELLEK